MGNSTIIELNHDLYGDIERNRDKFVDEILAQLRQGFWGQHKRIVGGQVVTSFHRDEVDTHARAWERFKQDIARRR